MEKMINGLDPLSLLTKSEINNGIPLDDVLKEAAKGTVSNILKSYTGFFDIFSEPIQNALDSTQKRLDVDEGYDPRIWVEISLKDKYVRVVDNGVGMGYQEFCHCFTPNVSFKRGQGLRGNKGVGATFLAYGFNYVSLFSRSNGEQYYAFMRGGRQWVEDSTGNLPRPLLQVLDGVTPHQLDCEKSGTAIEIRLSGQGGEKPKDLGWHGATTAEQWFDILRLVTPLGGIYINEKKHKPHVVLRVISSDGKLSEVSSDNTEFYYPHEIENIDAQDLSEIKKAIGKISGDHKHIKEKLPPSCKNLDCIYDVWCSSELLNADSGLKIDLTDDEEAILRRHNVSVYACHMHSAKTFLKFNESLGIRSGIELIRGGLLLACDGMPQGDLLVIPLKRYIGYQRNTFIIFHLSDGNPDLGRKVFQPEIKELAEKISVCVTNHLISYREYIKPDTGSVPVLSPDKNLYEWKKDQEKWRDSNPSELKIINPNLSYVSHPREEQDVVALYSQLVGAGIIKGINFFSTTHHDKYDALIELDYEENNAYSKDNPLGVRGDMNFPYNSEPKVLEYKYDFESILDDFDKEIKFHKHVDLVVCWKATGNFSKQLILKPLLPAKEGGMRIFYGSTHFAYMVGNESTVFEVCVVEELVRYLVDPESEVARQLSKYHDD